MTEDDKFIAHLAADLAANLVNTGALDLDIATRSVKIARMIVQEVHITDPFAVPRNNSDRTIFKSKP